jgi:glycosyltransferase involved in cell wall biosynthesis
MRICHINTRFLRAGCEENTAITCNGLVARGHQVSLVHGREFQAEMCAQLDPAVERHQIPDLVHEISPALDLTALIATCRLLRRIRPDVVHTHTSKAGIIGRFAARMTGIRHVVHSVHILPFVNVSPAQRLLYLHLERLAARGTTAFIDISDTMRDLCVAARVGDADCHHVVLSGMDTRKFRAIGRPADWRSVIDPQQVGVADPKFLLLAGIFEPRKRQRDFLPIFRRIADADPRAVLLFAGEGKDRGVIETEIGRLGLEGRVLCLGFRSDLERLIALADICVQTSMREGLPRTVIQYALGGRAVVATHTPGVDRIVAQGQTGFLVPLDDLDAMETPILKLLSDADLRQRMEDAARGLDLSGWDADHMVDRINSIYEGIARPSPRIAIAARQ